MNCQRDHGATPPSAAAVTITPNRFRKESRKTSPRPRKARPDLWREESAERDAVTRYL
jgi:hypothetical protein